MPVFPFLKNGTRWGRIFRRLQREYVLRILRRARLFQRVYGPRHRGCPEPLVRVRRESRILPDIPRDPRTVDVLLRSDIPLIAARAGLRDVRAQTAASAFPTGLLQRAGATEARSYQCAFGGM